MTGIRSSVKRFRDDNEQIEIKKAIRREQCRNNQARYRDRQRAHQRRMNHKVQQLHEEVQGLKLKRQRLRYGEKTKCSPWGIVSDVFRLLETSFQSPWHMTNADEMMKHAEPQQILAVLQKSFLYDVGMGDLNGVTALLEQLRRYSLYFSDPKLHLKRVEEVVPGVVTATAQFNVTVSEFTLRCVFPHLQPNPVDVFTDELRSLRGKLLGQRLQCNCKLTFLMDQHSGRVARLETSVDWMTPLFQLLKNASEVSRVLSEALLTRNCEVGELTHE
ncbi:Bzip transcription factor [Phytophthora megakarya]|uniref:Bzip transcription factor n=1 Tax=Phytophthora megakarya TaxID=4795 RepID=A0A225VDV7_9STRA|nr:Bzip transcription factor [Phytophthora megakarya]